MEWNTEFNSNNASAIFTDVLITQPGQYVLEFSAYTTPQSEIIVMGATKAITIISLPSAMMTFVLDADYTSVIGNDQESFIQSITSQLSKLLSQVTIYNVSVTQGSIIVTFTVQSENRQDVQDAIDTFLGTDFTITYNAVAYNTTNKTAEFTAVTTDDEEDDDDEYTIIIIIVCSVGGFFVILLLLVLAGWRYYKKRHTKVWRVHVKAGTSTRDNTNKSYEIREIYWQVSASQIEENEYVTNEPENEENLNEENTAETEAVALTTASKD